MYRTRLFTIRHSTGASSCRHRSEDKRYLAAMLAASKSNNWQGTVASVSPSPPAAPRQPPRSYHFKLPRSSNIPKSVHLCKGCLNLAHRRRRRRRRRRMGRRWRRRGRRRLRSAAVAAAPQPKRCRSKSGVPDRYYRYSGLDAAPHPVPETAPQPVLDTAPRHAAPHPVPATALRLQAPATALHRAPRPNSPRARGDMRPPPRSPQRGRARARTLPAPTLASSGAAHAPVGTWRRAEHLHAAGGAVPRVVGRGSRAPNRGACMWSSEAISGSSVDARTQSRCMHRNTPSQSSCGR